MCSKIRVYATTFDKVCLLVSTAISGGTAVYLGIYREDGTQTDDMASASVNAIASFASASPSFKEITLANAISVSSGDDLLVAILVTGTPSVLPQLRSHPSSVGINADLIGLALRNFTHGSGLSALPASIATISGSGAQMPFYGLR